jgi:hypothetical protein
MLLPRRKVAGGGGVLGSGTPERRQETASNPFEQLVADVKAKFGIDQPSEKERVERDLAKQIDRCEGQLKALQKQKQAAIDAVRNAIRLGQDSRAKQMEAKQIGLQVAVKERELQMMRRSRDNLVTLEDRKRNAELLKSAALITQNEVEEFDPKNELEELLDVHVTVADTEVETYDLYTGIEKDVQSSWDRHLESFEDPELEAAIAGATAENDEGLDLLEDLTAVHVPSIPYNPAADLRRSEAIPIPAPQRVAIGVTER